MERDKLLHFATGYIIGNIITLALGYWSLGMIGAILAASGKEIWDYKGHGVPDISDFVATVIGGAVGSLVFFW